MLKLFFGIVCIAASIVLFLPALFSKDSGSRQILCALLAILGLYLSFTCAKPKKQKSQPAAQPSAARATSRPTAGSAAPRASARPTSSAPVSTDIKFKVAGVTFDNDDGSSRQEILRHLYFHDAPYAEEGEEYDTQIIESQFNGELALEVHVNGYQIGFVPKAQIQQVAKAIRSPSWTIDATDIYGGGTRDGEAISWGCSISGSCVD